MMTAGFIGFRRVACAFLFVAGLVFQGKADLILHYAFEGDLSDRSSSNNVGTASGKAAVTNVQGQVVVGTSALSLDGADTSYVALSNAVTFAAGSPWSVAFWARRGETGSGKGMVIGKRWTSNDFIWLNDSVAGLRFRGSSGSTADFAAPKDQAMHHYALVASGSGGLSLYVDGTMTTNASGVTTAFVMDTVGQAYTSNTLFYAFKGLLDDVRVYNDAIDAAAVDALFSMGAAVTYHYAFEGDLMDGGVSGDHGSASGAAAVTTNLSQVAVGAGALSLDGAGTSYVALSNAVVFGASSPWSVAFWARRGETGGNRGMVAGCRTNNNDFIWLNDSYLGLRFRSTNNKTLDLAAPKDLNLHHYALVTAGNGSMSLYVDGVPTTNAAAAGTSFQIDSIGKAYTTAGYEFKGMLDEVHIYTYAITSNNVAGLYAAKNPEVPAVKVRRVHVFLQGGQSNADGRAVPSELPTAPVNLQQHQSDVDFYYLGALGTLYPATSSGTQFGPEVTCGRRLADLMKPDASNRVAIVKYAVGGTSLYSDWKAGGNAATNGDGPRYVSFQQAVAGGLAALSNAYPEAALTIEGMTWMQGESDVPSASAAYFANLTNFIADVRATYGLPELPFVIGRLSAAQTGAGSVALLNVVRQAQTEAAAADPWTGAVDTDAFALKTDHLHFNAAGQQDLGNAFAEQLLFLNGLHGRFSPAVLAAGAAEPDADPDGDGMSNWAEYLAGTDPSGAGSVLKVVGTANGGGHRHVLSWSSVPGRVYTVTRFTNLTSSVSTPVVAGLPAVPPVNVYTDDAPAGATLFYRIRADRP